MLSQSQADDFYCVVSRFVLSLRQLVYIMLHDPTIYSHTPSLLTKIHSYLHGSAHWIRVGMHGIDVCDD